jgi:hypothetical protein
MAPILHPKVSAGYLALISSTLKDLLNSHGDLLNSHGDLLIGAKSSALWRHVGEQGCNWIRVWGGRVERDIACVCEIFGVRPTEQ